MEKEGPKYQYGKGCLSDGVVGAWLSLVCGLDEAIDRKKILSHLLSVHKYNLKRNLRKHVNPQRSTFALGDEGGLLLCSWPKGGKLQLPFVYSNEVWTGIEYQVASHLMFEGEVEKDLILSVLVVIGMMEEYVTHLMNMNVGHGMPVQCLVMLCSKL